MTGRQGGVEGGRDVSPLDVVGRGVGGRSALAVSELWKNKLRRLDMAEMLGLKQTELTLVDKFDMNTDNQRVKNVYLNDIAKDII